MANELITKAIAEVERAVKPAEQDAYQRIVNAGWKVASRGGTQSIAASLKQSKDPVTDIVKGAIGVIGILRKQSTGQMPEQPMVYATWTLILHGLDLAERIGVVTVDNATLDRAVQLFTTTFLPLRGVTKPKLAALSGQVHSIMSDPQKMAVIKQQLIRQHQPQQAQPPATQPARPGLLGA